MEGALSIFKCADTHGIQPQTRKTLLTGNIRESQFQCPVSVLGVLGEESSYPLPHTLD